MQLEKVKFVDNQSNEGNSYICESCGKELESIKCKLKCNRCGYFRSCSDLF